MTQVANQPVTMADIAPMVILESATDFYNNEQVIISHMGDETQEDLYLTDGTSITVIGKHTPVDYLPFFEVYDESKKNGRENEAKENTTLEGILKNFLLENRNTGCEVKEIKACETETMAVDEGFAEEVPAEVENATKLPKDDSSREGSAKRSSPPPDNIQILRIEAKPPVAKSDLDLTSLNWLHKLNIVSVPSFPTPPCSPNPAKPPKKPNSASLRLQYGMYSCTAIFYLTRETFLLLLL